MEDYGIEEARKHLGDIVNRAYFTGEAARITRHGVPVAVVVSAKWHEEALAGQGKVIHHKDGNPYNNDPANIELADPRGNQ